MPDLLVDVRERLSNIATKADVYGYIAECVRHVEGSTLSAFAGLSFTPHFVEGIQHQMCMKQIEDGPLIF